MTYSALLATPSIIKHVCSFLHLREAMVFKVLNMPSKLAMHMQNTHALCSSIAWSPLEPRERFRFWQHCLRVQAAIKNKFKLMETNSSMSNFRLYFYAHALSGVDSTVLHLPPSEWGCVGGKAILKRTGQEGEILRDLPRTFPQHPCFKGQDSVGQNMLANILRALMIACPEVGYCQGMNLVAATIVLARLAQEADSYVEDLRNSRPSQSSEDDGEGAEPAADPVGREYVVSGRLLEIEADAFWLMFALMTNASDINMSDLWGPGTPKVKLRAFQYDHLLHQRLPNLHAHFKNMQFTPDVLVSQWFMTLFCYTLSLDMTLHIWDFIFFQGWAGMFAVALAILDLVAPQLTAMNLDDMGMAMRKWRNGQLGLQCNSRELILAAVKTRINPAQLKELQDEFAMELIRELTVHLKSRRSFTTSHGSEQLEWLFRYGDPHAMLSAKELQEFKKRMSQMDQHTITDVAVLQDKINQASRVLEQARKERDDTGKETQRVLQQLRGMIEARERLVSQAQQILEEVRAAEDGKDIVESCLAISRSINPGTDEEEANSTATKSIIWPLLRKTKLRQRSNSTTDLFSAHTNTRPISAKNFGFVRGEEHHLTLGNQGDGKTRRPHTATGDVKRESTHHSADLVSPVSSVPSIPEQEEDSWEFLMPGVPGHVHSTGHAIDLRRTALAAVMFDGPDEMDDADFDQTGVSRKWNMLKQLFAHTDQEHKNEDFAHQENILASSNVSSPSSLQLHDWDTSPRHTHTHTHRLPNQRNFMHILPEDRFSDSTSESVEELNDSRSQSHLPNALAFDYEDTDADIHAERSHSRSEMLNQVLVAVARTPQNPPVINNPTHTSPVKLSVKEFEEISRDTRNIQDKVIRLQKRIAKCTEHYQKLAEDFQIADTQLEEAEFWKSSLCDQLLQLVEEASINRSETLQKIADQLR